MSFQCGYSCPPGDQRELCGPKHSGSTEYLALSCVDLGLTALELGDPDTQFNPSLHFCTWKMEIIISSQSQGQDRWK